MGELLTKEKIVGAVDLLNERVAVPEWGGEVLVRGMSGLERDRFEASCLDDKRQLKLDNIRAKLVAACLVDENGKRLFSDAEVAALAAKSGAALDRLFRVAQRLSGLAEADVKELAANLPPAQSGASTSA